MSETGSIILYIKDVEKLFVRSPRIYNLFQKLIKKLSGSVLMGFGARVHTCSRNEDDLSNCLNQWNDSGFEVTASICDVSLPQQRETLMEDVSSLFNGKLNILINNVGTNIRKPMIDFTAEEFSTLIDTNLGSTFHIYQLAYPLLKASGEGSVVFTSSVSGFVSLKSMSVQGATKGAINQLTKNLACEWAKDNIRSNAVAPWYIKTSMVEQGWEPKFRVCWATTQCEILMRNPAVVAGPCFMEINHWQIGNMLEHEAIFKNQVKVSGGGRCNVTNGDFCC